MGESGELHRAQFFRTVHVNVCTYSMCPSEIMRRLGDEPMQELHGSIFVSLGEHETMIMETLIKKGFLRKGQVWATPQDIARVKKKVLPDAPVDYPGLTSRQKYRKNRNCKLKKEETLELCMLAHEEALTERHICSMDWFRELLNDGLVPRLCTYDILLGACAKAGYPERVNQWLEKLKEDGFIPSMNTYSSLISSFVKSGDLLNAERWMLRCQDDGFKPDIVVYTDIIHSKAKAGDLVNAEKWFEKALEAGLKPDIVTYNALVAARVKVGNLRGAAKWIQRLEELKSDELKPDIFTFTSIVGGYAKAGDFANAQMWFEKILEAGLKPNIVTYTSIIDGLAKAGSLVDALKWFEKAVENSIQCGEDHDFKPSIATYTSIIDGFAKAGDVVNAKKWFEKLSDAGLRPNIVTYTVMLKAYRGHWRETPDMLLEEMLEMGVKPNQKFKGQLRQVMSKRESLRWEQRFRL